MPSVVKNPEAEFEQELQVFDNDVDEVVQCLYIWQTVRSAARKSRKVYDLLNRNAGFWVVAMASIQANSLIALGRVFDKDPRTHNVGRLLQLAEKNRMIFSKEAVRRRKNKDLAHASHLIDDYMINVQDPTATDFKRLREFMEARRKFFKMAEVAEENSVVHRFVLQTYITNIAVFGNHLEESDDKRDSSGILGGYNSALRGLLEDLTAMTNLQ